MTSHTLFCVQCFACSDGGSWGAGIIGHDEESYCFNCGSRNSGVSMSAAAVKSIREQASWIGKRYYPIDEDRERNAELDRLYALVTFFPGRTAEIKYDETGRKYWNVTQKKPNNLWTSTCVFEAANELDAMRKSKLPYYFTSDLS